MKFLKSFNDNCKIKRIGGRYSFFRICHENSQSSVIINIIIFKTQEKFYIGNQDTEHTIPYRTAITKNAGLQVRQGVES
jgi:hypothetical protein